MNINENNLRKKYWQYIIPSIIAQVVFSLYTMVDALMVARGVSAQALAGVNIAAPYVTVLWALAITFAVGTSTIISRLMGEGRGDAADEIFTQTVLTIGAFGIVFGVVTYFGAGVIGDFLGATENTREFTVQYIRTVAPFSVAFIVAYLLEILMPIDGHPKMATVIVSISVVANCVLDYVFIFILDKGVWGAAFATGVSQTISTVCFFIHFIGRKSNIRFRKFGFDRSLIGKELYRGLPSGVAEVSPGIATFIFVQIIGRYIGEDGIVAYSTISYVATLLIIVAVAIGQGSQPLTSYFNGAKRPDVIRRLLRFEMKDVAIISVITFVAVEIFARDLVMLFIPHESPELIAYAVKAFRLYVIFSLIDVYSIVLSQYATSLERPISGVLIAFCRTSVFLLAGIYIMIKIMGPEGIWLGMTVSEAATLVMALIMYKKNGAYLTHLEKPKVEEKQIVSQFN